MILDGKKTQEKKFKSLKTKVSKLKSKPVLVIVQIGENKASEVYIKRKVEFGKKLGVGVEHYQLKSNVSFNFVKKLIQDFNEDSEIKGIIVQLPLPKKFNQSEILELIDPEKDVDGLTSVNVKKLVANEKGIVPATTRGILTLLKEYKISLRGKDVVVISHSFLVGRPTANLMLNEGATVTICHEYTKDLQKFTKEANIIITAVGKPGLLKKSFVKEGQVVIDVGTSFVNGKLIGDASFGAINKVVKAITPVPGGVGPMTVLSLFENLVDVADKK